MSKAPSQAAANYVEPDFEYYKTKAATPTQEHFGDWVIEKTGITFATKKEEAAFRAGITIGTSLRGVHQASPENQERLVELRAAKAKADAEALANPKPAREPAPARPAKATKATAPVSEPAPEAAPAKRAPAKRAPAKRPAVVETSGNAAAPF